MAFAFDVNIEELFNFYHHKEKDALLAELNVLLKKASESQIKLIYRIVKDILK